MTLTTATRRSISRRAILRLFAAGGSAALLSACGGTPPPNGGSAASGAATTPVTTTPAIAGTSAATTAPVAASTSVPTAAPAPTTASALAGSTAAPSVATGVTIQIATRGGTDGATMEKNAATYKAKFGVTVQHVSYGAQPEYWAKIQALHATKQAADVLWASTGGLFLLAYKGILADLQPIIQADKYDLADYVPSALESMKLNGKLYGMPWGGHPGEGAGILYNLDLLSAAGVTGLTEDCASMDAWTWDDLSQAAVKATKQEGGKTTVFGFMPFGSYLSLTNTIGGFGGDFLSPDGKKLTMDTPQFKSGLQQVSDFYNKYKVAPTPDPSLDSSALFAGGKIAMVQTGYWGQFTPGEAAIKGKFKWNVGLVPKGPAGKRGSSLTINGQTLWSGSAHKDEAWGFIKWLMEPNVQRSTILDGGSRPALRKSVIEDPELMSKMKAHKCFVPFLEASEPWKQPWNFRWEEFNQAIVQVFTPMYLGKQTVDQAIADATKKLQAILDEPIA